jgi:hypothetical protein
MPKSFFGGVDEYSGPVPSGGYKCVIEEIERGVTGENAKTPGSKKYTARLRVVEPKRYAGTAIFDTFTIGTEDDPKGRDQETWRTSLGAKKLFRLLKRAGVPAKDGDDEEWMDAAQGQEVCAHVMKEVGLNGGFRNNVNGDYYKETDEDFVGVGESLESGDGARGGRQAKSGNASAPKSARGGRVSKPPVDDDDDAPPARKAKPSDDEEADEEEDEKPKAAVKAKAKGKRLPKDDDEGDDDED